MSEHPKDRPAEPEDPFQMMAGHVVGDPGLMLDCLVEEFSRMGHGEAEILALFDDPIFLATHGLKNLFGPEETAARVRRVLASCGVIRVSSTVAPPEDPFSCHRS